MNHPETCPPACRLLGVLLVLATTACATPAGEREHRTYAPVAASSGDARFFEVERELAAGDPDDAADALQAVDVSALDESQRILYRLFQSEIALMQDRPLVALQALPPRGTITVPALAQRAERDRALALFRMGDSVAATQALVYRDNLLADPAQRLRNRELLWNGLRSTDLDTAVSLRLAQADRVSRGWVELAVISRSVWMDAASLHNRVQLWRDDYPGHPADDFVPTIPIPQPGEHRELSKLALLLPLSGPYAATAEAVRDGFFASYYRSGTQRPQILVYDTGTGEGALRTAYRRALDDGAEFIVGPLRKEDVTRIATLGRPPVPVLALNYLDADVRPPFNLYQWGLAPEDEARQAAERAVIDHHYRAVALVPEGDWGTRVLAAFQQRLYELGGTLVAARGYALDARDHSEPIRQLLDLDASYERHRALTAILGTKTDFEPRRRDDVDMIFIAARPEQARLIWPQFRFHRASDLPIYATSLVYDGETPADDLHGLRFCDMPWMLATDGEWTAMRNQLYGLFPERGREYSRLLALGHDTFTLVTLIDSGQLHPGSYFPAASGTLSLGEDGVIARGLRCAEIRKGALEPLEISVMPPP